MNKSGVMHVYPDFIIGKPKDLMVRGKAFYAFWDEEKGMWSTDEAELARAVDRDLKRTGDEYSGGGTNPVQVHWLRYMKSGSWNDFKKYLSVAPDATVALDSKLTFQNTEVKREDYVSKRLPYALQKGKCPAWNKIIGTLYGPSEREKIEWAIGAIVNGASKEIQKFLVFYGDAGKGKSTILNIIQKLFEGYYTTFEAKALTSSSNAFSTDAFRSNPLVAIQHDGDLSRIEDNSKLNSIISHEEMQLNEKYKPSYTARLNCFLFMATNRPVKITDAKSGIIRRLIDVTPSGNLLPPDEYFDLMEKVDFELGAIAWHCKEVYEKLGKNYYSGYKPFSMMYETDPFFNFVENCYGIFKEEDGVSLKRAWAMYKEYSEEAGLSFRMPMYRFREELKDYFREFYDVTRVGDQQVRSYFHGFRHEKFETSQLKKEKETSVPVLDLPEWLRLTTGPSVFDIDYWNSLAQYATPNETPTQKWEEVRTLLKDIDTSHIHYVKPSDEQHIVIDFDLKDEKGEKSLERNLDAARNWPETYAEISKGGAGLHLHYIYDGDVERLSRIYDEGIEIKVFTGKSSLRRKLTKCNNSPIAHISSGLPLKGDSPVVNFDAVLNEKAIRELIKRNLRKEIHPNTAPSIDFIKHILDEQYEKGAKYDVSDMRTAILAFANKSTNQARHCLDMVREMKFKSEEPSDGSEDYETDELIFYDVEVFPNLFLVTYKIAGPEHTCVTMINPKPADIEKLMRFKLVGFNSKNYDDHMIYACYLGWSNKELFRLSDNMINHDGKGFREARNISYTDVLDFSSKKQGLKKFEIELGIHHQELGLPWDKPVPEELWPKVAEYCANDVIATEAVFNARKGDWLARQILADLSGLPVNASTNSHTTTIIFGDNRHPGLIYTDLATGKQYLPGEKGPYDD